LSLRSLHTAIIRIHAPGTTVKGMYTKGRVLALEHVRCNIQPVSGRSLEFMPEGVRDKIRFTVFLEAPLTIGKDDIIEINGVDMKIYLDERWVDQPSLNHNKIYAGEF
jgi:hypothetical protein